MRKVIAIALFLPLSHGLNAQTDDKNKDQERPSSFAVSLSQDNAFGFLPSVTGSFPLKKFPWDLTYYGNFWTNPGYAAQPGSDFFLETGIGLGRFIGNGRWFVNPALGFAHGSLLSGARRGLYAEGIVPGITALYRSRRLEGEFWGGWYKRLRSGGRNTVQTDYFLAWAYAGMFAGKNVSMGMHFENFRVTSTSVGEAGNLYTWIGVYVKFFARERYWFRFATGWNVDIGEAYGPEYYRLTVGIPFVP